eukprot:GHUV01002134.1.p1 GENE.GHUV01002134.1~~GHUV01002134.1.p1  ORF type:complete len:197 (+),score=50.22 GHUV01002134.1:327-917(+)
MALTCRTGSAAGARHAAQPSRGQLQLCRSRLLHGNHGHGDHHVAWYEKHKELWTELKSEEELQAAFGSLPAGKMLLVDYYASWCAVCKTAYPGLSRLAANKEHLQHFVFAKASLDQQEIKDHIKREGVRGIPHLSIYNSKGAKLLGMGASFKRLEAISFNLRAAAAHKDEVMQQKLQLQLDPNCFVLIPGAPVTAA